MELCIDFLLFLITIIIIIIIIEKNEHTNINSTNSKQIPNKKRGIEDCIIIF